MFSCNKTYSNYPFAHRQHLHDGHCALIHGHNWAFEFDFRADELDSNGFVIDFGKLEWLKAWLDSKFDHTLVLNHDDPALGFLRINLGLPAFPGICALAKIVTVGNCGAEGLATFIHAAVNEMLQERTGGRVYLASVTVHEDSKNKATYSAGCTCGE